MPKFFVKIEERRVHLVLVEASALAQVVAWGKKTGGQFIIDMGRESDDMGHPEMVYRTTDPLGPADLKKYEGDTPEIILDEAGEEVQDAMAYRPGTGTKAF
jgi:hypothetical protein